MAETTKSANRLTATTTSYGIGGTTGGQALYTATTAGGFVSSVTAICNKGSTAATYRLSVSDSASSNHVLKDMIVDGATVPAYDTVFLPAGIAIANGEKVWFSASSTNVNIVMMGVEIS